jgi:hypothetical protein
VDLALRGESVERYYHMFAYLMKAHYAYPCTAYEDLTALVAEAGSGSLNKQRSTVMQALATKKGTRATSTICYLRALRGGTCQYYYAVFVLLPFPVFFFFFIIIIIFLFFFFSFFFFLFCSILLPSFPPFFFSFFLHAFLSFFLR